MHAVGDRRRRGRRPAQLYPSAPGGSPHDDTSSGFPQELDEAQDKATEEIRFEYLGLRHLAPTQGHPRGVNHKMVLDTSL